ncbi:MAG: hypothetical protein QN122_07065 [Armatimonadota bacterium]|nr:hypothetical protein [Armatimonadota bacterium]MDR7449078.1 hypothetical protein [Armatimonadota bacterium]MDR7459158.1 hypothetical protein [Armatimonadota bacterium]MDR7480430.1 hypothetical protein [Armatimonadota bacterium]MDR7489377.1 hypothetical protein [Armatimonadota bacterium]
MRLRRAPAGGAARLGRLAGSLVTWGAFAVAVYSFSELWGALRGAWEGHPTLPPGPFLLLVGLFLASLGYLAVALYAAEARAGRVRRRIGLFDRLLTWLGGAPEVSGR